MMVLPVAAATASMTWPISASLKLGVMRWPLLPWFWALTMPVAANAHTAASSVTRKEFLIIAESTLRPERELVFDIVVLSRSLVPGNRFRRLLHRDIAFTAAGVETFRFGRDLGDVQHEF